MIVKDEKIQGIINRMNEHYRLLLGNKFIQGYLNELSLARSDVADIEDLVNANRYYETQGYDLERMYDQIYSYVHVLKRYREEALPKMKNESQIRLSRLSENDRIRFKMTVDSVDDNLRIARNDLRELYDNVKRVDLATNGQESMVIFKRGHFKELESLLYE